MVESPVSYATWSDRKRTIDLIASASRPTTLAALIADLQEADRATADRLNKQLVTLIGEVEAERLVKSA